MLVSCQHACIGRQEAHAHMDILPEKEESEETSSAGQRVVRKKRRLSDVTGCQHCDPSEREQGMIERDM